jgi:hypothetical protein
MDLVANQEVETYAFANRQQPLSNVDVALQTNSFGHHPQPSWRNPVEVGLSARACNAIRALRDLYGSENSRQSLPSGMTPASDYGEGYCRDASQVWTFRHSPSTIRPAARTWLENPI